MRVVVGMSGGVDSSVAAFLLKKKGYEVYGVNIEIGESKCCDIRNVEKVCALLGIQLIRVDAQEEFQEKVVKYFIEEYKRGRTPNPCNICNREIKFKILLEYREKIRADKIATGHYAGLEKEKDKVFLKPGKNKSKSQEYFLCLIPQEWFKNAIFPLENLTKEDVVKIAEENGLIDKKGESQDVCFLKDETTGEFLEKIFGKKEGKIITEDGKILGVHNGYYRFTIGQRKGVGISYHVPLYVKRIIPEENLVIVAEAEKIFFKKMFVESVNFYKDIAEEQLWVKIRYRHRKAECLVRRKKDELHVEFMTPQKAVTPGQIACFYDKKDRVVAGGIIKEAVEK